MLLNNLLGFALHYASPQVEGLHPPESGVSTAILDELGGCGARFCSVAFVELMSCWTPLPLESLRSYGGEVAAIGGPG